MKHSCNPNQHFFSLLTLWVLMGFLVAGCGSGFYHGGTTTHHKHIKRGYNKSYKIKGIHYTPLKYYDYSEVGIASYYGPRDGFHGRRTSTGEIFNEHGLTAAHKTLPLPCVVRVTNLKNGRSIKLRVNDRGPFVKGRIIDVSGRAAQLLGFVHEGITKVRVEALVSESIQLAHHYNPRTANPFTVNGQGRYQQVSTQPSVQSTMQNLIHKIPNKPPQHQKQHREHFKAPRYATGGQTYQPAHGHYIQVGTYGSLENARNFALKVTRHMGLPCKAYPFEKSGRFLYRVLLGPLRDKNYSKTVLNQLKKRGIHDALLVYKE